MKNEMVHSIHPGFTLNGHNFDLNSLKEVAYSLVKEGEGYEQQIGDFLLDWCSESTFLEVRSSGSTGPPKTIRLSKSAMQNSALATAEYFGLKPGTRALLCLPAGFIAGKMMLVRAMVGGWALSYVNPTQTPLQLTGNSFDFAAMVPSQALASLPDLHRIQKLILGGSPLTPSLEDALTQLPVHCYETFGMTETVSHIAVREIGKEKYFQTLPRVRVEQDPRGCLLIHAPAIADEAVRTNDLVRLESENSFEWLGRIDFVINSGGIKYLPEQIEEKLTGLIDRPYLIAGQAHQSLGEQLVLVLEGKPEPAGLLEAIRKHGTLTKYEMPREIICLDRFAFTENGKINRKETLKKIKLIYE